MRSPHCVATTGAAIRGRPFIAAASGEYQPSVQRMPLERLGGHNAVDYQKEEPWPDPERLTIQDHPTADGGTPSGA